MLERSTWCLIVTEGTSETLRPHGCLRGRAARFVMVDRGPLDGLWGQALGTCPLLTLRMMGHMLWRGILATSAGRWPSPTTQAGRQPGFWRYLFLALISVSLGC